MPGQFRVARDPQILTTLLGSCVAACLFDPVTRVGGMNHFLLPVQHVPEERLWGLSYGGRYGIEAMELLINGLLKLGAAKVHFQAKVFGGAALMGQATEGPGMAVGESNVRFIRDFLRDEGIPIVGEDLGGYRGRVIRFHTDSFAVWRRYLRSPAVQAEVVRTETEAWRRGLAASATENYVDFRDPPPRR